LSSIIDDLSVDEITAKVGTEQIHKCIEQQINSASISSKHCCLVNSNPVNSKYEVGGYKSTNDYTNWDINNQEGVEGMGDIC